MRFPTVLAAVAALAVLTTSPAQAHHGAPFKNCTEAYEAGYANIPEGSEHYAPRLDRDGDGIGCDKPPTDFVPAEDSGEDLAETGGSDATPYVLGASAVLLAGGSALLYRRRRSN